jgi:hypothetical protein
MTNELLVTTLLKNMNNPGSLRMFKGFCTCLETSVLSPILYFILPGSTEHESLLPLHTTTGNKSGFRNVLFENST